MVSQEVVVILSITNDDLYSIENEQIPSRDIWAVFELQSRPDLLHNLKGFIRQQVYELLDVRYTFTKQKPESWAELLERVCQRFPELFDNGATRSGRIQAIIHYAGSALSTKRSSLSKEIAGISKGRYPGSSKGPRVEVGTSTRKISPELNDPPKKPSTSTRSPYLLRSPPAPRDPIERTSRLSARRTHATLTKGRPSPKENDSEATEDGNVCSQTSHSPPTPRLPTPTSQNTLCSPVRPVPSRNLKPPDYQIDEVATFLRSCEPDMEYLLGSFIGYGCRNQEFLTAVANWSEDEIDEYLRDLVIVDAPAPSCGGLDRLTEMDIRVLKRHLKLSTKSR